MKLHHQRTLQGPIVRTITIDPLARDLGSTHARNVIHFVKRGDAL